ncbi:MAG: SRPBCC family protein [Actinomycetes bacterium]
MARYVTTISSPRSPEDAFAYMADLRHFADWDPGVKRVAQVDGDGAGPGAEFDVTVAGPVGNMTLRYRTLTYRPATSVVVEASNLWMTSHDRIVVEPAEGGCTVTYDAEVRLRGPLHVGDALMAPGFDKIGDRAAEGLRRVLDGEFVK